MVQIADQMINNDELFTYTQPCQNGFVTDSDFLTLLDSPSAIHVSLLHCKEHSHSTPRIRMKYCDT